LPGQAPIRARPANYLVSLATGVRGVHREITRNTYTQSPTCGGGGGYVKFGAVLVNGPLKITVLITNFQSLTKSVHFGLLLSEISFCSPWSNDQRSEEGTCHSLDVSDTPNITIVINSDTTVKPDLINKPTHTRQIRTQSPLKGKPT